MNLAPLIVTCTFVALFVVNVVDMLGGNAMQVLGGQSASRRNITIVFFIQSRAHGLIDSGE